MPTLHTNGINLKYDEQGQGEPLLFLHGLGSQGEDWGFQVPFFAPHYRVVTVDLRGHGESDKPAGPYSVSMMADDVVGLLDALKIESAHIVGLSMGGMIAFQLVVDKPERVRSMVIVVPSVRQWPPRSGRSVAVLRLAPESVRSRTR